MLLAHSGKAGGSSTNSVIIQSLGLMVCHPSSFSVLRRHQAQTVWNGAISHKIQYVAQIEGILNLKRHHYWFKDYNYLTKWVDFDIGEGILQRVYTCSPHSRLV